MNDTPDRLISAATRLFAQAGFNGASVRDITAAAGANLGAITYHFGSKQDLYRAVLQHAFAPVVERLSSVRSVPLRTTDESGLDRVETIMRVLFRHIAANPDVQMLILRQVVQDQTLPGVARQTLGGILETMTAAVRQGQEDGSIRAGDPVLMAVSVMSQPAYFGLVRRLLAERLNEAAGAEVTVEATVDHAVRFVRAGLSAGAREDG